MGAIGKFGNIPMTGGVNSFGQSSIPEEKIKPLTIEDGVSSGYYEGSEIQDPRAFFNGPEIKDNSFQLPATEKKGEEVGFFNKPEIVIEDIDGFYLAQIEGPGKNTLVTGFPLNGPGSSQIESLGGKVFTKGNNPRFLTME